MKDNNPKIAAANGVQNTGATSAVDHVHDGGGALAVPINVDSSSSTLASVAVPFCQSGVTANLAGFKVSFWVKFVGEPFSQASDDVFLFVDAWSASGSSSAPALFKNKMVVNDWINVTYTFPMSIAADHLAINLHPGGQWEGAMYLDSVLITGL